MKSTCDAALTGVGGRASTVSSPRARSTYSRREQPHSYSTLTLTLTLTLILTLTLALTLALNIPLQGDNSLTLTLP